jgi:hypothetical protein
VALTPENLTDALACRSREAYAAFRFSLSQSVTSVPWMDSYFASESNGMLYMHAYRIAKPISVFGREIGSVFFSFDGIFAALNREDALRWVADNGLERLPSKLTRQYYKYLDEKDGRVLTAFESEEPAISMLLDAKLGLPHEPGVPPDTLFAGCSYTRLTPERYVERAALADQRIEAEAEIFARQANARSNEKQ